MTYPFTNFHPRIKYALDKHPVNIVMKMTMTMNMVMTAVTKVVVSMTNYSMITW